MRPPSRWFRASLIVLVSFVLATCGDGGFRTVAPEPGSEATAGADSGAEDSTSGPAGASLADTCPAEEAEEPSSGDYRSADSGAWAAAGTWETYDGSVWDEASSAPGAGTTGEVTVCDGDGVEVTVAEAELGGELAIQRGATLDLNLNDFIFTGDTLRNNGTIANGDGSGVGTLVFAGDVQSLESDRQWGDHLLLRIESGSTTSLTSDIDLAVDNGRLEVAAGATLNLNERILRIGGDSEGFHLVNEGTITTPDEDHGVEAGISEIDPNGAEGDGVFEAPLLVQGETKMHGGTLDGAVTISGQLRRVGAESETLEITGDLSILSGDGLDLGAPRELVFSGGSFRNSGTVTNTVTGSTEVATLTFAGTTQSFESDGEWSGHLLLRIESGSTTSLASDVFLAGDSRLEVAAGATLDLNGRVLAIEGDDSGPFHLVNDGNVTTPDEDVGLEAGWEAEIDPNGADGAGVFEAPLLVRGDTEVHGGTIGGAVAVASSHADLRHVGAESERLEITGDVLVCSTCTLDLGAPRELVFSGGSFRNSGTVTHAVTGSTEMATLTFAGTAQSLESGGGWGDHVLLRIEDGSTTTLDGDVLFDGERLDVLGGGTLSLDTRTLDLNGADALIETGGRLVGTGTLVFDDEIFDNRGTIAPGLSAGTLGLTGTYSHSDGTLEVELGGTTPGTEHDQVEVDGDASLGGTLDVTLLDGFTPSAGDEFTILTCTAGCGGQFSTIDLPEELDADPVYEANAVRLVVSTNSAPEARAGGPYTGDEGSSVAFDGFSSVDPDGDDLMFEWDFGDGTTASGPGPSHTYADDGSYDVALTVTDPDGATDTDQTTVMVENVAPTATLEDDGPVDEGSDFHLSLSDASDPSPADVDAGFEYAFDCGDGDGYGDFGSASEVTCGTVDDGVRDVRAKISDKDGGVREYTASVTVENVAPTVDAGPDVEIFSGETFELAGSFSDPGIQDDPWAYEVDWGGPSPPAAAGGDVTDQALPTLESPRYFVPGDYSVTLTVTDEDGGVGMDELTVTVRRLPVSVDVKPGSDSNVINVRGGGLIPVAALTGPAENGSHFDATLVDWSTVRFGPGDASEIHERGHVEDVEPQDGDLDMMLHFDTQETEIPCDATTAVLVGATGDGVHFTGSDVVRPRCKGRRGRPR